tara:strand:+ start:112692 stop:113225 length:534 start_codon:yes stop_codon:yes gene_type:complete
MIPSFNKFSHLNKGTDFNRWDLIPRYLAIEEHFGENDYGWEMFRKLRLHQSSEFADGSAQTLYDQSARTDFEVLIDSMQKHGYKRRFALIVNQDNLKITKGWSRFACCLYFEIDTIPCKYDTIDPTEGYDLNWMQNDVGYETKEINQIVACRDRIFDKIESKILDVVIDEEDDEAEE